MSSSILPVSLIQPGPVHLMARAERSSVLYTGSRLSPASGVACSSTGFLRYLKAELAKTMPSFCLNLILDLEGFIFMDVQPLWVFALV